MVPYGPADITAEVICDSFCHTRITSLIVTAPRYILVEWNTHRCLNRNSASSRAIPVDRRAEQVLTRPALPPWWCANQRGMQSYLSLSPEDRDACIYLWRKAANAAVSFSKALADHGAHKQIANRPMEAFVLWKGLVTATEWANKLHLRSSRLADPAYDLLALRILRALRDSTPRVLQPGEWHVPFGDRMYPDLGWETQLEVSAARCARLSYENHHGQFDLESDLRLAREVLWQPTGDDPPDASPFEHQAQAAHPEEESWRRWCVQDGQVSELGQKLRAENALWDGSDIWWGPLRWWRQWRKMRTNETRRELDSERLIREAEARWRERLPDQEV